MTRERHIYELDRLLSFGESMCPASKQYWKEHKDEVLEAVKNTKEGEWIPCSERLPNDDELMLVTYIDPRPEAMDIWIGWHEMENVWYIDGEAHSNELGNEVVAWMPLPKPFCEAKMKGADDE